MTIFTGTLMDIYTLVFLIEVQDILIIFQDFSSKEVFIKDRTIIFFQKFWIKSEKNSKIIVKKVQKPQIIDKKISPGYLFKTGDLLIWSKFPPRTFIQDRTCIKNSRVMIIII